MVVGLPESGKSTFLAAAWHVAESGSVPGALVSDRLVPDRAHLNAIRDVWLQCKTLDRTVVGSERLVSMRLCEDVNRSKCREVQFPDLSGESFLRYWVDRRWARDFDELAAAMMGVLLFIHPERVTPPARIDEAAPLLVALGGSQTGEGRDTRVAWDGEGTEQPVPWDPLRAPTQVILVDLLQSLATRQPEASKLRVSVVVSAWDLVSRPGLTPDGWLDMTLPLLMQYLQSNEGQQPWRVYGVSAQGGDVLTEADRLRSFQKPEDRIQVCEVTGRVSHDITLPIKWVLGLEAASESGN
jgi:hypothetical protein